MEQTIEKKYINRLIYKDSAGIPRCVYFTGKYTRNLFGLQAITSTVINDAAVYDDLKTAQQKRPAFRWQSIAMTMEDLEKSYKIFRKKK